MREHFTNKLPVYLLGLFLGGLMLFYYFVFIPQNEQHLVEHANRLLDNKARSVIEKYNGYRNAVATSQKAYFLKWYFDTNPNITTVCVNKSGNIISLAANGPEHFESINTAFFKKALIDKKFEADIHEELEKNGDQLLHQDEDGQYHFVFEPKGVIMDSSNKKKEIHPYLSLRVNEFTSDLKSTDFFDDLFLVFNRSTQPSKDKSGQEGFVIDTSRLGLIHFNIPDSIQKFGTGSYSKKIGGKFFRVFVKEIKLNKEMELYVVALIAESELHRLAREVPAWFMIFCLLGSLMLIFLYPVIKIFTINHYERLSATDARLSIYSMILSVSLATILMVGSYIFMGLNSDRMDRELEDYSNAISKATVSQVDSLQQALNDLHLFSPDSEVTKLTNFKANHPGVTKFNEVFSLRLEDDTDKNKAGSAEDLFTSNLSDRFDLKTFPVQVSSRDYFRFVKAAKQNNQKIDYILQSINSYTSGRSEAALSIIWEDKSARVITSRLPSIIRPILPAPYKFVVIDKTGDVKFHSEWNELQSENFISECNSDFTLSTFLSNNVEEHISFTYLRYDCRGYFRPLAKDWRLIVYYEVRETRSLAAEIFGLSLLSLALVVICTGLIHLSLIWDRANSGLLKTKTFFYYWLNPLRADARQWLYLFAFGLLLFIAEIIWLTCFQSITASISLVFIVITLFYCVTYGNLNKKYVTPKLSKSMRWLIGLALLWFTGFIIVSQATGKPENICFIVIALLVILILMNLLKKMKQPDFLKGISRYFAYRLFILTTLLVVAAAPAWIFISEHYYYSSLAHQFSQTFTNIKKAQIKSIDDQQELRGINYTGQKIIDPLADEDPVYTSYNRKNLDFVFYRLLQDAQLTTESMTALKFDLLPSEKGYDLSYSTEKLKVVAPQSLILPDTTRAISEERVINRLEWRSELTKIFSTLFLALLILTFILWRVIKYLPRKIFFAPDKIVWNSFPERKIGTFLEREFENDDDKRHLLHRIRSEDKEKLIKEYADESRKKTDKSTELLIRDRYILKLQELAKDSYTYAWSSCSEEEQHLIYDLSADGVTNLNNQVLIGEIAEKGLIRLSPRLEPLNRSFANFVLNSMSQKELAEWREKEDKKGNWSNLRLILIIIVATAFVFLSMAEENFVGRITALIASVGLIFPKLVTVFTSVGNLIKTKPAG